MKGKIKTLILLFAGSTFLMFIINKIIYKFAVLKDLLNKNTGNYYEWRFGKVFYTKQGHGKPLLLIHDLDIYSSSYEWNELVKELSQTNTVYAIDLLGCGRSDKPNITYTNFLYVQMITDFIKNIIGHKTNVASTGASGSFTIMACYNDSDLIDKILLINPEGLNKLNQIPTKRNKSFRFLMTVPILGTFIYNLFVNKKSIQNLFKHDYFYNPANIDQKIIDLYYESSHLGGPDAKFLYSSIKGKYINTNIVHALKSINNSIYIIESNELTDNKSIIENYVSFNPSIETAFIEKTNKLPQLEAPDKVLDNMKIFF